MSTDNRKLQLEAEVADNTKAGFDSVKNNAAQMAQGVEQSAARASKAVDGIGTGADAGAQKLDRSTKSIISSVQRATAAMEAGERGTAKYFETLAGQRGANVDALKPYLAQLKQAEAAQQIATGSLDKMGVSAKQTAFALRGVPAQFTDIITSLQGGQAPLTILLQQGGQLKDMFGGVGNAARALGGYVVGLINPFTLVAAAVGGIAVAYKQGSAEADGYRMALVMTGNAAGTTAAQMQQMAGRISSVVGTQGAAAEALAQMASNGRVASQSLEYFSEVAIKFERTTGTAISETVKRFAELGASPVDASRKLNEETNYLTASIYEQIKALKDQGREADAAALAQTTYADALNNRSAQITQNLGAIEGAWKAITDAAKSGWDAMLNVGRADSLGTQIDNMRAKIAQAKGQDKNRPFSMPWDTSLADLEKQLSYLTEQERVIRRGAEAQAQRTQAEKEAIAATDALQKTQASGLTNQQKMNKALEEYASHIEKLKATNPASVLLSPDAIARGEKAIRDQFSDKGKGSAGIKAVNKDLADQQRIFAELAGVSSTYYAELANAQKQRAAGVITEQQYVTAVQSLIEKQPFAVALAKEEAAATQALSKAYAEAAAERIKTIQSMERAADGLQSQNDALREEIELIGLSTEQQTLVLQQRNDAIILTKEATLAELERQSAITGTQTRVEIALASEIEALKERNALLGAKGVKNAAVDAAKTAKDEWQKTTDSINQSLTDSLLRGFESGKDMARNLRDTVVSMFKTMVLRPVISAIINPISGAITGMMGLSGAAQAATGGAGALSTVGSIGSGVSMLSGLGAFGGGVAGGFGGLMGSLGMSATGATFGGAMSAGSIAMGAGNIAGGLGTLAGALGPIAIGIALLSSIIKKSTPHMGAASSYSAETGLVSGVDVYRASGLADTRTYSAEAEKITATVAQSIAMALDSTAVAFGKKAGYEISTAFADDKSKDGAWGSLIIKQMGDAVLDWRDTQTSKWAPREFADGEQGGKEYQQAIAKSVREVIDGMGLPEWAARITRALPDSATMDDLTAALAQVQAYPAQLLQQFGTTRDALVQQFAQGLASGDAASAGQSVADTLVASIQNAVFTNAAGQIFDIVNMGIVTPMLDAIATGASVADALSQATIDKTIERAKAQAQVLGELFGNAEFAAAMEQLRTAVGGALGQAGGYLQALPQTLVATQQIDTAAQDAKRAADEAQRAWQQITDGLLSDQATMQIELLRAQGREEEALARERALAIDGMDAYQTALYDSNRALRSQIDTLRELGELLPAVIDQYLTPEQRTSNAYSGIANDLVGAGLAGMNAGALAQALAGATKGEIAEAATAIYNMTGVTDEMRVALLRAAGSLATLKDEAASVADAGLDSGYAALERAVQARRSVVQDTVNDVRAVFDSVRSAARDLFGEVDSVAQFQAQAGRQFISQSLSAARTTGYLPDGDQLSEAIGAARAGLGAQQFASQAEADFQRLVLANELRDLQDISGDQLTEAEKQLRALDGILDNAREQIDAMRGIDSSVMSVEAAIAALAVAMARESAVSGGAGGVAGKPAVTLPGYLQGGNGAAYDLQSDTGYQAGTGLPWMGQTIREAASELVQAGNARAVYDAIAASGFSLSQADSILQIPAGTAEEWARSVGLPVFHTGTNFVPQTGLALLEKGEAVIPRAYNPAALGVGGNTERLEQLVEVMAAELAQMRAQLDVANRHAARTADATNGRPEAPVLVEVVA